MYLAIKGAKTIQKFHVLCQRNYKRQAKTSLKMYNKLLLQNLLK